MDDKRARREARARGLHPVWTLTVLDEAAERGLIPDITERLEHLEHKTPFRINRECKAAIESMKQRHLERKQAREPAQGPEAQTLSEHQEDPAPEPPAPG
jgi:predicted nucleic acid-binding protein